jgi:hypothetical protein
MSFTMSQHVLSKRASVIENFATFIKRTLIFSWSYVFMWFNVVRVVLLKVVLFYNFIEIYLHNLIKVIFYKLTLLSLMSSPPSTSTHFFSQISFVNSNTFGIRTHLFSQCLGFFLLNIPNFWA